MWPILMRHNETIQRVRATLRRAPVPQTEERDLTVLETSDLRLDVQTRKVIVLGNEIYLTPKEFDLLAHLYEARGKSADASKTAQRDLGAAYGEETKYLRVFVGSSEGRSSPIPLRLAR